MSSSLKQTIFRRGSTTYFYASKFFPTDVREDVSTLYAYVRVADDFVDNIPPDKTAFQNLVRLTWKAWNGEVIDDEVVGDFVSVAQRCNFEREWVQAFLWSMEQDLGKVDYQTFAQLERYIYGSAEVIGLMMGNILGLAEESRNSARAQGKAMQFLNFIRDVEEDKRLGRVYMPAVDREKFGIGAGDWSEDKWSELLRFELRRYFEMQREAEKGYRYIPRAYRIPVQTAADMYMWTSKQIEHSPTIVWKRKVKPSKYRVVLRYFRNCLG